MLAVLNQTAAAVRNAHSAMHSSAPCEILREKSAAKRQPMTCKGSQQQRHSMTNCQRLGASIWRYASTKMQLSDSILYLKRTLAVKLHQMCNLRPHSLQHMVWRLSLHAISEHNIVEIVRCSCTIIVAEMRLDQIERWQKLGPPPKL